MTTRTRDSFALLVLALLPATTALAHRKDGPPHMVKPHRGMQMKVGPVDVPRGSEVTECTYFKLPHGQDLAVNRVKIKVQGGSHHIHIYRPTDPTRDVPNGHEICNMAVNFDEWELVLASQSQLLNWKLPPGIAFHFTAHEQLLAQTHFVDNGLLSSPPRAGLSSISTRSRRRRSPPMPARSSGRTRTSWSPRTRSPARPRGASSRSR